MCRRAGRRSNRNDNVGKRPLDLGYYMIVTDTECTEKLYLEGLKDKIPKELKERLTLKVSKAKTSKLVDKCLELMNNDPQYRIPWIVFDRDRVTNFNEIIEKAHQNDINVGWSNPCIEIWFFAYFGSMPSYRESTSCCTKFGELFKEKCKMEYDKNDKSIYKRLSEKGNENKAIVTAEKRLKSQIDDKGNNYKEMYPGTTLHCLIKEINSKIKENL